MVGRTTLLEQHRNVFLEFALVAFDGEMVKVNRELAYRPVPNIIVC
jgi:hypothetical protein